MPSEQQEVQLMPVTRREHQATFYCFDELNVTFYSFDSTKVNPCSYTRFCCWWGNQGNGVPVRPLWLSATHEAAREGSRPKFCIFLFSLLKVDQHFIHQKEGGYGCLIVFNHPFHGWNDPRPQMFKNYDFSLTELLALNVISIYEY